MNASDAPTIYYIGYVPPRTGGEWVNLQHVASLARLGVRAVALVNHAPGLLTAVDGLKLPFEVLAPGRTFGADDVIVIPEFYREAIEHFSRLDCRRVLHVQGPFLLFRGVDSIEDLVARRFLGGLACSQYAASMMERMGARLGWRVVTPFVHPYFVRTGAVKHLRIAYMPDKRPKEAPVVRALFRAMFPEWAAVPWQPIRDLSRAACAEVMAGSAVFASFSCLEGLGLPPLEAMSADCLVCGFTGHGGGDYAKTDNGFWVAEGDHEAYARALAAALALACGGGEALRQRIEAGRATAGGYNQTRFEHELIDAWRDLLGTRWPNYQL